MATELFNQSCVYSRLESMFQQSSGNRDEKEFEKTVRTGLYSLQLSRQRNRERLDNLENPLDEEVNRLTSNLLES